LEIQRIRIADLKPDPQNARKHDEQNLSAIAGSLREFGQRKPIVITTDNIIAAGNGTVEAAKRLGWLEIEAVRVPADWDSNRIKAFAIADNRTAELAAWQPEVLASQLQEIEAAGFVLADFGFIKDNQDTQADFADALEGLLGEKGEIEQITFSLHTFQAELVRAAIEESKAMGEFGDTMNKNNNGNALARIVELWKGSNVG
jgi:ParB-like chromosome segregation protein Spo0J